MCSVDNKHFFVGNSFALIRQQVIILTAVDLSTDTYLYYSASSYSGQVQYTMQCRYNST